MRLPPVLDAVVIIVILAVIAWLRQWWRERRHLRCSECGGDFDPTYGCIIHWSGCGSGWPEGRPMGAGVDPDIKKTKK
jgi:hypothetical protein